MSQRKDAAPTHLTPTLRTSHGDQGKPAHPTSGRVGFDARGNAVWEMRTTDHRYVRDASTTLVRKLVPPLSLEATAIVQKLTETDLSAIKYYHFTTGRVDGVDSIISRTGYTGEDGFEVYAAADAAIQLWNKILETGKYGTDGGIIPCGLAARNTLRLESAMSLYGHELGDDISPLEAGLGWITKFQKGPFTGSEILAKQKEVGVTRKIAGFEMTEPGIARDGCDIYLDGEKIGVVTSGSPAPFLKKNIGLAFLPPQFAIVGQEIKIDVRGRQIAAKVVSTPFYKRSN